MTTPTTSVQPIPSAVQTPPDAEATFTGQLLDLVERLMRFREHTARISTGATDSRPLGAETSPGIEAIQMDLLGDWDELGDRQFDAVVAGEILEHLYFPEQVVCKIRSRLKEDGVLVGSVPNAFSLKNRLRYLRGTKKHTPLSDPTHINQFSAPELEALLARHFREVTVTGLGRYTRLAKLSPNFFAFDLAFVARP